MDNFLLEKVGKVYNSSCLMLYINLSTDDILKQIKKSDLGKEGLEDEPHITLMYGFEESVTIDDINNVLKNVKFGDIKLTGLSLFENEEDVLKIDVEGVGLQEAHKVLKKLPNNYKYDEYIPHITIGYLKKGKGKKYLEKFDGYMKDEIIRPMFVVYSPGNKGDNIVIGIKKDVD